MEDTNNSIDSINDLKTRVQKTVAGHGDRKKEEENYVHGQAREMKSINKLKTILCLNLILKINNRS